MMPNVIRIGVAAFAKCRRLTNATMVKMSGTSLICVL